MTSLPIRLGLLQLGTPTDPSRGQSSPMEQRSYAVIVDIYFYALKIVNDAINKITKPER